MFESCRELYEEYLTDLAKLASKRSRLNVRRFNQQNREECGRSLSRAQFAELATDLTQSALADHWERFSRYCASLSGDELSQLTKADSWLQGSKLRFPRRFALAGAGLSTSRPSLPHWTNLDFPGWNEQTTLCDDLLTENQRYLVDGYAAGLSDRQLCADLFGGSGGRQWKAYKRLRLDLLETLSFIAQLSAQLEPERRLSDTLDALQLATIAVEPLPQAPEDIDHNAAFDKALWYSRQGTANPQPQRPQLQAPEAIDWNPVKTAFHAPGLTQLKHRLLAKWKPGRQLPPAGPNCSYSTSCNCPRCVEVLRTTPIG